jgi:protein ATS1
VDSSWLKCVRRSVILVAESLAVVLVIFSCPRVLVVGRLALSCSLIKHGLAMSHPPTHLYAAGSNANGQLATGDFQDAHTFMPCSFAGYEESCTSPPSSAIAIVGGGNHTLAHLSRIVDTTSSNQRLEVWGCGDGTKGQLGPAYVMEAGDNRATFRRLVLPLEEQGLSGYAVSKVAACWETTFLVLSKEIQHDVLISMGGDDFGDLGVGGLGPKQQRKAPFHIIDFSHIVGTAAHHVSITDITAGPHHAVVVLRADNKQYIAGWGTARHGQLGPRLAPSGRALPFSPSPVAIGLPVDVQLDPVLSVCAGNQHSLFLHASGRVSVLGSDAKGQLHGLHATKDVRAIHCSWNGSYVQSPTTLLSAGANARGQLGRADAPEASLGAVDIPKNAQVLSFACGSEHVLCLLEFEGRKQVWGWGWNEHGNLGTGSLNDITVPIKVWPPSTIESEEITGYAVGVWAGCGTSWIALSQHTQS